MTVYQITHDMARSVWPRVKGHLNPAIERSGGRWTSEYVLASLVTGEHKLWAVVHADSAVCIGAATTQIIQYPEKRFVAIHFLGGDGFEVWYSELLQVLCNYAADCDCDGIECNARFGFWKFFKKDGFKKVSTFYEKVL